MDIARPESGIVEEEIEFIMPSSQCPIGYQRRQRYAAPLPCTLTVPRDKGGRTSHVRLNDAAVSALLRLRGRTLETGYVCGGSGGATDWFEGLSLNRRDYRILVALSPPHLCQSSRDGWCRSANRGRIAQGQDDAHGDEVFASRTRLHARRCAADGTQVSQ